MTAAGIPALLEHIQSGAEASDALFNLPESPDSSTCKQPLQVGPNVEDLTVGQVVCTEYGPATLKGIDVSKWRFSEKPKHRLTFQDNESGYEYTRSYFPDAPLIHNQETHFGQDPYHSGYRPCPIHGGHA